jgi:diguanylate cyclase
MTDPTPSSSLSWRQHPLRWLDACAAENALVADEFATENLNRLRLAAPTIVLVDLVAALMVASNPVATDARQAHWWLAILLVQGVMAATFTALGLLVHWRLSRPPQLLWDQSLGLAGAASLVLCSAALSIIDQWVKQGIMTMVIGLMASGMIFLIRPLHAIALFSITGLIGIAGLAFTQTSRTVLVSDQATVIAAVVAAIFLANLLWREKTNNLLLRRSLRLSHMVLEQKKAELEILARNDPLTGLFNRREFTRLAGMELARAERQHIPTAFVMVDLDLFKRVNDTWGHPVGDEVLKNTAMVLSQGARQADVVARVGGEEILLLLPNTDEGAAVTLANRLREALEQTPLHSNGLVIPVTASFGVAVVSPGSGATLEHAYIAADEALYKAKQRGRNRVECAPVHAGALPGQAVIAASGKDTAK